jgi:hypothetical protein
VLTNSSLSGVGLVRLVVLSVLALAMLYRAT